MLFGFRRAKSFGKAIRYRLAAEHSHLYASLKSGYINCNLMNALKNTDHSIYLAISQNIPDAHNTLEQYQVINPSIEGSFLHNTKYLPQLEDPESLLNICRIFF